MAQTIAPQEMHSEPHRSRVKFPLTAYLWGQVVSAGSSLDRWGIRCYRNSCKRILPPRGEFHPTT